MHSRYWLVISCLAAASVVSASDRGYPFMAASLTAIPDSSFEFPEDASEFKGKEYRLVLGVLAFEAGAAEFDLGVDYQYTRYEYTGIDGRNRDLHRLQLPVGFSYAINKWRFDGFVAPGVSTSSNIMKDLFDEGSRDDLIVTARLEGTRPAGEDSSWLAGFAYDRAFGKPVPYPVFGMLYRPQEYVRLRLTFPDPAIEYVATSRQQWMFRLFPAGHEWHVFSEELNEEFDYAVEAWRAQLTWSLAFRNRIWLDLSAGYEFNRHHEFVDDLGRTIDADAEDQLLFAVGLRFGNAPMPYTHSVSH